LHACKHHKPAGFGGLWYGHALVRRLARLQARLLVIALLCAVCGVIGAASGADTGKTSRQRVGALRNENATLAQRIDSATLSLYALDSKLRSIRAQLASVNARREQVAREQRSVRLELNVSRHNLHASQRQLALLVHTLYEQQASDPIAVVLGAQSLDEAISTLDELSRASKQNQQIATRSREARRAFATLNAKLARQATRIRALASAATSKAAALEAAQSSHQRYISTLLAQRHLNLAQLSTVEAQARASAATSTELTTSSTSAADATSTAAEASTLGGNRTITVTATGYATGGTTATGLPVGWGTVAVDPGVIPLGTQMTIPGYGNGVAADTGSAVRGATIDLWFPTMHEALAWGRRVVTVTLH
jgi:3D (Asp-Asp-Asp) domain-containing protein